MSVAKRPRLAGSFSPASPPYHLAKGIEQTAHLGGFQQPQTPTSPPSQPMSASSGPAIASTASTVNTQLTDTPASSVAGTVSFAEASKDGESDELVGQNPMKVQTGDETAPRVTHMRTDHERIQEGLSIVGTGNGAELRDYLLDVDVRPYYKLSEKPFRRSDPHPSQNLIALFDLEDIAASVQRKDPKTGEKINKLRKSYEGKIKDLGIAGRNRAVDGEGDFETLMAWPEEEWRNQRVFGKEISTGLGGDFEQRLERALRLPAPQAKLSEAENDRWRALLATEEPTKPRQASFGPAMTEVTASVSATAPSGKAAVRSGRGLDRPERSGKKRRYDDASFAGYGEGFVDDALDGSDDDQALSMRRKRFKG